MPPKVPTSDMGTAMLGMMVARTVRRNTNTTMMTRKTEISSVVSMSFTDARTVTVRSIATVQFDRRRNGGLQIRHERADPVHSVDDVRARLPEDRMRTPGFAVG